jgi:hypothetical protein
LLFLSNSWLDEAANEAEKAKIVYNSGNSSIPDTYNDKEYTMESTEVKRFAPLSINVI